MQDLGSFICPGICPSIVCVLPRHLSIGPDKQNDNRNLPEATDCLGRMALEKLRRWAIKQRKPLWEYLFYEQVYQMGIPFVFY